MFKINNLNRFCFCIVFIFLVIGCQKPEEEESTLSSLDKVPKITPNGSEKYLNLKSDYIFNQDVLHTFELKLPPTALAKLDQDPGAEEYVEGMLIFQGDTISPVGIRYKGSIGAFAGCLSGTNIVKPSGFKKCTKLSIKVDIKWKDRKERFYDLNKLQFHSQNNDRSQMRERMGYWLFREMGTPAPRSVHAKLIINGKYNGLYALTEQVDSRFSKYNFKDDEGNVYKDVWPLTMQGKSQSTQTFLNALETNKDEQPTVQLIKSFSDKLAAASTNQVPAVIQEYMDMDKIMSYIAVDRIIRHDDGPFHWYCSGGGCGSHNFYWYEEPTAKKIHLVAWDMDNAFENIITNVNPVIPIADKWGEVSNNCMPFVYGSWNFQQWSASCDKLTAGWAGFKTEYEAKRIKLKEGLLSANQIDGLLNKWSSQIRQATVDAKSMHNDAISVIEWETAMNNLRNQVEAARKN